MKKTIIVIIAIILVCSLVYVVKLFFNNEEQTANATNIKKVKEGMSLVSVIKIMGKPKDKYITSSKITLLYSSPSGSADDYRVTFSQKDSLVIAIYYGYP